MGRFIRLEWDLIGLNRTGQDRTGQDRIGRDGTGRDGTGQTELVTILPKWHYNNNKENTKAIFRRLCKSGAALKNI